VALTQSCVVCGNHYLTDTVFLLYVGITIKLYAVIALVLIYGFCQVLYVQTGFYCVHVMWRLLCVDFGSGLCWGDGYVWPSQDWEWAGDLWLLGFQKCVKDLVGEDSSVIVQVVVSSVFCINVESFYSV